MVQLVLLKSSKEISVYTVVVFIRGVSLRLFFVFTWVSEADTVLFDLQRSRATVPHGSCRIDLCADASSALTKHLRAETACPCRLQGYENQIHLLPKEVDEKVGTLHFPALRTERLQLKSVLERLTLPSATSTATHIALVACRNLQFVPEPINRSALAQHDHFSSRGFLHFLLHHGVHSPCGQREQIGLLRRLGRHAVGQPSSMRSSFCSSTLVTV